MRRIEPGPLNMHFNFLGLDDKGFDAWIASAKSAGGSLGRAEYLQLEKPSQNEPVRRWGTIDSDLYRLILNMMPIHQMSGMK